MLYKEIPYSLLKIKPDSRLTGTFYDELINAMHSTLKPIKERVSYAKTTKYNGNINLEMVQPITYEIYFDGDNKKTTPTMTFGLADNVAPYMKQRIQAIFPNSTLTFENDYSNVFDNGYVCEYTYEKDNMLSLKIKDNNLLQSLLNMKSDIKKGEHILFQVEMLPISDMWKSFNEDKWDKVRQGKDVTTKGNLLDNGLNVVGNIIDDAFYVFDEIMEFDGDKDKKEAIKKEKSQLISSLSSASKQKRNNDGFRVRIRAYFAGCTQLQARAYSTSIEVSLMELEEDNRLKKGSIKNCKALKRGLSFNPVSRIGSMIMSSKELGSIVNIPNQKIQREFRMDNVNMKVTKPPKECLNADWVRIGTYDYHGEINNVYFPSVQRNACLTKLLITLMGGGKTNAVLNMMVDSITVGNGVFLIDHIDDCPSTKALQEIFPNRVKVKDMSDNSQLFGFCYPEIHIEETDTIEDRLDKANDIAYEVEYLINSSAVNTDSVSDIMSNYLFAACKVVFIHNYKTLKDFIAVLMNKKIRDEYIQLAMDQGVLTEDSFEVMTLRKLDESDKEIKGLLNRLSVFTKDSLFQRMLNKECDYNDSLVRIFDKQIPFSVMLPQEYFSNKKKKDIITTFLLSRVRLAIDRKSVV